eukprot:UN02124
MISLFPCKSAQCMGRHEWFGSQSIQYSPIACCEKRITRFVL